MKLWKKILIVIVIIWFIVSIYSKFKPLPDGLDVEGDIYNVSDSDIDFLYDLNYYNETEDRILEQEIFENVFGLVDNAQKFIVIDMFLFNTDYSDKGKYINLTRDLKDKLVDKKKEIPDIEIFFTTDEINNFYGSYISDELQELEDEGIVVIMTDHTKLRDSNPLIAGFWRAYIQWWGTSGKGWMKHPLGRDDKKVTLRSWLKLLNTKANHRKVIVTDCGSDICSIVTSANPHEASSLHSNVGVFLKNSIAKDILDTEIAVAKFSGTEYLVDYENIKQSYGNMQVQLLTEKSIRDGILKEIGNTEENDSIDLAMFYISDRKIVNSLIKAANRGVEVNIILDPNKDAFAREKNGVPNRPVAWELLRKTDNKINFRWYDTQGAQFHTKILVINKGGRTIVFLGSANFTKRNIGNFNLEMNVKVISPDSTNFAREVNYYFERIWLNEGGIYTANFEKYKDTSLFRYWLYRFQEATGLSSF